MNIAVTGGAGFIGSHLCDRLIELGHSVTCVDNFFTGQKQNIEYLLNNKRFHLIEHDITKPLSLSVEMIYNLACPASPIHYQQHPIQTIQTSTVGMVNMLEVASEHHARILQASTSEVYGDPDVHPQPETYHGNVNPIGPRACYDEGKRVAETLCMDYHRAKNVDIRIVRIFNTYGPRMHPKDGRVVSNFITQALSEEPITIYGDGNQTRSFCYIDDMIDGIMLMMGQTQHKGPINIGNPQEISVRTLAESVIRMTNSSSSIILKDLPQDDPRQRQPDISLAKKILHWEPKVPLEEGLKKTIDYFQQSQEESL